MLRAIVGTSVRFRMLIIGIAGALLLIGATQVQSTRVDVLPEFTPPYVEVQTEALGLSAEEVEELVTVPLEADLLHGVAFLDEIRSESIPGLSSIVLIFEPGTDIFKARQVVAERLTQAHALPNVARAPVMLQPLSSLSRFMVIGMSSQEKSLIDMSVLARWTVRPRLMGVPGVANVSIFGQRERQLQVLVDPAKLDSNNVSLEHVVKTAGNALWFSPLTFLEASTPGTGGFIDTPQQRLGIQHILPIQNAEDLAQVAIETEDGATPLKLGDVATVVEDHQQLIGDGLVNDGSGLILVIEKFPDVNTLDVTRGVEAAMAALQPGLPGIDVDTTLYREATFIDASLGNVSLAILIGFLLIAVIIGALLFDWRAALISIVTIPLSIAAAAIVLHLGGASLNAITLAGLLVAISVVIDDAAGVVDDVLDAVPHTQRRRWRTVQGRHRHRRRRREPLAARLRHPDHPWHTRPAVLRGRRCERVPAIAGRRLWGRDPRRDVRVADRGTGPGRARPAARSGHPTRVSAAEPHPRLVPEHVVRHRRPGPTDGPHGGARGRRRRGRRGRCGPARCGRHRFADLPSA